MVSPNSRLAGDWLATRDGRAECSAFGKGVPDRRENVESVCERDEGGVMPSEQPVLMPSEVSTRLGFFDKFAGWCALIASRAYFFTFCVLLIVVWAPTIAVIRSIDTWQLVINTVTTIIT